ncbi:MAG: class I SAM-dependent methyltransferase [Nocardioidaceae bacterium]
MNDHYFTADPGGRDVRRRVEARIWDRDYTFTTSRGVFSAGRLDKATEVLLRTCVPPTGARTVLDLGCGWGPIACAIAVECADTVVHAVDTNERALELVRVNAADLELAGRVVAMTPDEVADEVRYDEIWSNPPIRIGKAALHQMLLGWLPRLAEDGVARLVVGKNLGSDSLQRWLVEQGWRCERRTSVKGFRVLVVSPH